MLEHLFEKYDKIRQWIPNEVALTGETSGSIKYITTVVLRAQLVVSNCEAATSYGMEIDLVFSAKGGLASGGKTHTAQKAPGEIFFRKILEIAARELKLKESFGISVNLVGESKIKELNRKYRKKNKATDVLSFPMQPKGFHRPEGAKRLEGPFDYAQGQSNVGAFDLGDIFICLSIAKKEAKRENVSIEKKLAQLTVHGFLHLVGYNHDKSEEDAKKMFRLENKILSEI